MKKIKISIVGIGNCASSLIQGIHFYRNKSSENIIGLMHWEIGGFKPGDIDIVAAFDIDKRKVGKDVNEAVFSHPNCTTIFCPDLPPSGVNVQMGRIMDSISDDMKGYDEKHTFVIAKQKESSFETVVGTLRKTGAEVLLNYLPVGSEGATKFYAQCALEANVSFINCMPVFIASES